MCINLKNFVPPIKIKTKYLFNALKLSLRAVQAKQDPFLGERLWLSGKVVE
jgi:hypothetical protein